MTAEIPRDQQANIPNNRPEEGSASSDQLLVLKEELMQRFGQLPPHHQASVALVMLNTVADGELEERMREAITLRFPQVNPFAVGHDNLRQTHLREDQISKLSDQDLAHISRMLRQHYEQDVFLLAAPIAAELVLAEKQKSAKPEMLDQATREKLLPLYSGEEKGLNNQAKIKFFLPRSDLTWYASEGSPVDENGYFDTNDAKVDFLFFGLVSGLEVELGYVSLSELAALRSKLGLPVERDRYFKPKNPA